MPRRNRQWCVDCTHGPHIQSWKRKRPVAGKTRQPQIGIRANMGEVQRRVLQALQRRNGTLQLLHQVRHHFDLRQLGKVVYKKREITRCVGTLLESLQATDREALQAIAKGATQEEFASEVGLSPTGARSRVQRARSRLKDAFTTCCRIEFDGTGKVHDWHRRGTRDDCGPSC